MMRKLKVLQLMTDSKIGGAERVVFWLAKGLDKERFDVSVCSLSPRGPIFDEIEKEKIKVFTLDIKCKWDIFHSLRLIKLIKTQKTDILQSHLFHANLLARIIGKIMGVPVIISTEHIMGLEKRSRLFINRATSLFVDKFIAISFSVGEFLTKTVGIKLSKIRVVQNGIAYQDSQYFNINKRDRREEFGFSPAEKIVGTVARMHEQKGYSYLLRAAQEVIRYYPEVKFLLVGDGPLKNKMEQLAVDLKITKNVLFKGFYKDVPAIMSIFDIFVLPSLWEGLPITILEAMVMRKPVIATKVGGVSEAVKDGLTGLLVEPCDYLSLSGAIMRLLNDEELRFKMGRAGYKNVSEYFDAKMMVEQTEKIYDTIISEKNKC